MRKSRFTEAQIIGMIKEQEAGMATAEATASPRLSKAASSDAPRHHHSVHYRWWTLSGTSITRQCGQAGRLRRPGGRSVGIASLEQWKCDLRGCNGAVI